MKTSILALILVSGSLFANPTNKTALKSWRESSDGIHFTKWEASPVGQKVHAGAIKINRAIRGNAQLKGVVTSRSLPEGSHVGYGFMVKIDGMEYMLAFGPDADNEFDGLRNLQVNDQIIIKSHHVSKAPKYAFAILSPSYVTKGSKLVYKRIQSKGGC